MATDWDSVPPPETDWDSVPAPEEAVFQNVGTSAQVPTDWDSVPPPPEWAAQEKPGFLQEAPRDPLLPNRSVASPERSLSDEIGEAFKPPDFQNNLFRPAVESAIDAGEASRQKADATSKAAGLTGVPRSPGQERTKRLFSSSIAGQGIKEYQTSPEEIAAGKQAYSDAAPFNVPLLNISGGELLENVVEGSGHPVNFIPGGAVEAAGMSVLGRLAPALAGRPILGKILQVMVKPAAEGIENAAYGLMQGDTSLSGAVGNFVGGAALKSIFPSTYKAPSKVVGILGPQDIVALGQEVRTLQPDGVHVRTAEQAGVDPAKLKPLTASVRVDEAGNVYGRVLSTEGLIHDTPLKTEGDAVRWHTKLYDQKIRAAIPPFEEFKRMDLDVSEEVLLAGDRLWNPELDAKKTTKKPTSRGNSDATVNDADPRPKQPEPQVLVMRDPAGQPQLEVVKPLQDTPLNDFGPGQRVVGTVGGIEIVGNVKSIDANGNVHLHGHKHPIQQHQLRGATTAEVLRHASMTPGATPQEALQNAMRSGREMSLHEAAAVVKLDLPSTRQLLADMEARGEVTNSNGHWDLSLSGNKAVPTPPSNSSVFGPPPAFQPGDYVYVMGDNGKGMASVVGMRNGRYQVKRPGSLVPEEFKAEQLRATTPPGIAPTKGVTPSKPILDGGPPLPSDLPVTHKDAAALVVKMQQVLARSTSNVEAAWKRILHDQHRGPLETLHHIREVMAVKSYDGVREGKLRRLQSLLPGKKLESAFDKDLDTAVKAKTHDEADAIMAKHGAAWTKIQDEIHENINQKNILSSEYERLTGGRWDDGSEDFDELMQKYVTRRYWATANPEEWAKVVAKREDTLKGAVDFLIDANKNNNVSRKQITEELEKILRTRDPVGAWGSSKLNPYGNKSMLTRKDIPEPIRKVMGEWESGALNLAETLGRQHALVNYLQAWENLTQNPTVFSPGAPTGLDVDNWVQLDTQPRKYGPAAGGFVRKEIFEAMANAGETINQAPDFIRAVSRFVKGNMVVWNGRSHLRSLIANFDSSVAAGGFNPLVPSHYKLLKESFQQLKAYNADPTADGPGAKVYEALKYGGNWRGQAGIEIRKQNAAALKAFDSIFSGEKTPSSMPELLSRIADVAGKGYGFATDKLAAVFDFQDELFRMANYNGLYRKFSQQGMAPEAAARAAADRINLFFMNAQNVGRTLENARSGGIGIAAPFLTSVAEGARNRINMMREFAKPDWGYRGRMAAWHGLVKGGLLFGGAVSAWNLYHGNPPDEAERAKANLTKSSQTYKPGVSVISFKDAKGRHQAVDLTMFEELLSYGRGNTDNPQWANIATNIITAPMGETAANVVQNTLAATGMIRPPANYTPQHIEGDTGLMKVLTALSGVGATPSGPTRLANDIQRMQPTPYNPMNQPLTGGQVAARQLIGVDPVPPGPQKRQLEFKREVQDAKRSAKASVKSGKGDVQSAKERIQFLKNQIKEGKQ